MSHDTNTTVEFRLNGEPATALPGETLLAAARRYGVAIPTLCHHPAVSDYGSCRLCVVEARWGKRAKIVTSCIYRPYEGDEILTDSDRVQHVRRTVIRLLLAQKPEVEELQRLAREYGVDDVPETAIDTAATRLERRCILCGICVRVCDEAMGCRALGRAYRGAQRILTTPFGESSETCIGCRACVNCCPTGALTAEDVDGERRLEQTNTRLPLAACDDCGASFTTVRQREWVGQRTLLSPETLALCPDCRRRRSRQAMEKFTINQD